MQDRTGASLLVAIAAFGYTSAAIGGSSALGQEAAPANSADQAWTLPSNEAIRNLLAERMEHNGVGVVVGVVEPTGRRIVVYGKSGADDGRPLDGDTVFQIGSVTKTFTTLILADMAQRGEIKLDDPASKYLSPGWKMPQRGRPITLRDLATHMSGLPSLPTNFPLRGKPDPYEAYSVEQLRQFLASYVLTREPGEKWEYSNLGVSLLGRLLANHAGMEYEALLEERVLKPLGMNSTSITLTPDQLRRLAPGHDRYLQPVHTWEMRTLPASGSLRSTANDMLTFMAAYLGYQATPLKAAMALQLSERVPTKKSQVLGWGGVDGGTRIVTHAGGKQGYRSGVAFDPVTRTGVIVLANANTDDQPNRIALHLLTGRRLAPASAAPSQKKPSRSIARSWRSIPVSIS